MYNHLLNQIPLKTSVCVSIAVISTQCIVSNKLTRAKQAEMTLSPVRMSGAVKYVSVCVGVAILAEWRGKHGESLDLEASIKSRLISLSEE